MGYLNFLFKISYCLILQIFLVIILYCLMITLFEEQQYYYSFQLITNEMKDFFYFHENFFKNFQKFKNLTCHQEFFADSNLVQYYKFSK